METETTTNTIPQVRGPRQVIVMRTDLNMRKGKMAAMGGHASMMFMRQFAIGAYHLHKEPGATYARVYSPSEEQFEWLEGEYAKIVVGVGSEAELLALLEAAEEKGLTAYLVTDNGHTEFHGVKTNTCICIGPHHPDVFIGLTNHLKLL